MTLKDWVGLVGLVVTICSLIVAQLKANKIQQEAAETAKKSERRLEIKLKIFQILLGGEPRSLFGIVEEYNNRNPSDTISNEELHKSVYEMLVDGTIASYSNQTFSADSINEDDEDDDDD